MNRFTFFILILLGFNFVTLPECISQNIYVTDYSSTNSLEIFDVINLLNGEVVALGSTINGGKKQLVLFKNDANGKLMWANKLFSSSTDYYHNGRIVADNNNNTAVLASTVDVGKTKTVVVKVDNLGNVVWSNKYNNGQGEVTNDIAATNDGGYVLTGGGCIGNNLFVHKISANGNSQWFRLIGSTTQHEMGLAVTQLPNDDLVIAGTTLNASNLQDVIVFRLDMQGNVIWEMNYGSSANDFVRSIAQKDGFIYLAGNTQSVLNSMPFVSKINANSKRLVWNKVLTSATTKSLLDMDIFNNSLTISGLINSNNGYGNDDASLTKLDLQGNLVKSIVVGDAANNIAKAISSNGNGLVVLSNLYNGASNIALLDNDLLGYCDYKLSNIQVQNQVTTANNLKPSIFSIGVIEEKHILTPSNFNVTANNLTVNADFNFTINSKQIALNNLSAGAVNYSWDFGDGSAVNDASPNHVFANSGIYTVCLTVTNAMGCTSTKCVKVCIKAPNDLQLGIDQRLPNANNDIDKPKKTNDDTPHLTNDILKINAYPNPVINDLNFEVAPGSTISSVSIFSGNGQLLGNTHMGSSKGNISVADFAPGVYLYQVKIENQNGLINGRFIKN